MLSKVITRITKNYYFIPAAMCRNSVQVVTIKWGYTLVYLPDKKTIWCPVCPAKKQQPLYADELFYNERSQIDQVKHGASISYGIFSVVLCETLCVTLRLIFYRGGTQRKSAEGRGENSKCFCKVAWIKINMQLQHLTQRKYNILPFFWSIKKLLNCF